MPAPTVHPHTQRLYDDLPEVYRDADVTIASADERYSDGAYGAGTYGPDGGYPLLRFLSLVGDQAGTVEDLIDRIDPDIGAGSELVDPARADAGWLPWLAMLVGILPLAPGLDEAARRNAITGAVAGWRAGTRPALEKAAKTALTSPDGYVAVRPNYNGDPFTVGVSVDPATAPANLDDVVAAIEAAHARPAGIRLIIDNYSASWATLTTGYPTWADLNGQSWATLEGTR